MIDARPDVDGPTAGRRPSQRMVTAAAVLLVLGGGAALTVGLSSQLPDPPAPPAVVASRSGTPTTAPTTPPTDDAPPPVESAPVVEQPLPVQISIPSLEIASDLITVGLQPDGTLEVPQPGPDFDRAAWFNGSPRPGGVGPAVIEGHVDGPNGRSVFYDLGAISAGAQVLVTRADGSTVTFVVDKIQSVPKDAFPTLEVYGNTPGPELRLITCGGEYDSGTGHYKDNVVVFAHLVA